MEQITVFPLTEQFKIKINKRTQLFRLVDIERNSSSEQTQDQYESNFARIFRMKKPSV